MVFFVWILILILLIILIIWPPFGIFIGILGGILIFLWWDHTRKIFPPIITWGTDPQHEIIVKWFTLVQEDVQLQYKKYHQNNGFHSNNTDFEWITIQDTISIIENSSTKGILSKIKDGLNRHIFLLYNLEPGTSYQFQIVETKTHKSLTPSQKYIVTTAPNRFEKFRFVVCGDMQQSELLALLENFMIWKIKQEKPSFLVYLGDHVHSYKNSQLWIAYFRIMRMLFPNTPFYTMIGNHCGGDFGKTVALRYLLHPMLGRSDFSLFYDDIKHDQQKNLNSFENPELKIQWNYTWQYQNLYFIAVNSLPLLEKESKRIVETETWLREMIAQRPVDAKFILVYMHIPWIGPPYSNNGIESDYEKYLREHWKPILDDPTVDVAFFGHKHAYIREGKYIVSASMHGVRKYPESNTDILIVRNTHHYIVVEVEERQLIIKAVRWNGSVYDQLILQAK